MRDKLERGSENRFVELASIWQKACSTVLKRGPHWILPTNAPDCSRGLQQAPVRYRVHQHGRFSTANARGNPPNNAVSVSLRNVTIVPCYCSHLDEWHDNMTWVRESHVHLVTALVASPKLATQRLKLRQSHVMSSYFQHPLISRFVDNPRWPGT